MIQRLISLILQVFFLNPLLVLLKLFPDCGTDKGVMIPNIEDMETGLKLSLVSSIKDSIVGIKPIATFLLSFLNSRGNYRYANAWSADQRPTQSINSLHTSSYVQRYNLESPQENIEVFLDRLAHRIGALRHKGRPDHEAASHHFVKVIFFSFPLLLFSSFPPLSCKRTKLYFSGLSVGKAWTDDLG